MVPDEKDTPELWTIAGRGDGLSWAFESDAAWKKFRAESPPIITKRLNEIMPGRLLGAVARNEHDHYLSVLL